MVFPPVFPVLVYTVAALILKAVAAPQQVEPTSPCPKLFHYDSVNDPGRWTGSLALNSEDDLHGVWIRLIFDNRLEELTAEGYEVVQPSTDSSQYLIKNRDALLEAGSTTNVRISVKYDGDKFPNLIGYRLNAKAVCPDSNTIRTDFFKGDGNSKDLISSILSNVKPNALQPVFECGIKTSETYPWQASVSIKEGGNDRTVCDASLISPSHVLLPAHCVTFRDDIEKIPETIISVTLAGSQEKIGVSNIIVHGGYAPDTLSDDLAVLELDSAPKISEKVAPICVDDRNFGSEAFLAATGVGGRYDVRSATVDVIDGNDCARKHPKWAGLLQDSTLCGSYSPSDNAGCIAKSGSGIYSSNEGSATLVGMVTLLPQNENHCKGETTAIATNVTRYYKWILRAIA